MRKLLTVLAAGSLLAGVAACGSDDDSDSSTTESPTLIGPVVVDVATVDGTTVETTIARLIDLDVGDTDVTAWTAEIADPAVLTFVPGSDDGSATFNPGLTPTAVGTTTVTLTDGRSTTVEFTVEVTDE